MLILNKRFADNYINYFINYLQNYKNKHIHAYINPTQIKDNTFEIGAVYAPIFMPCYKKEYADILFCIGDAFTYCIKDDAIIFTRAPIKDYHKTQYQSYEIDKAISRLCDDLFLYNTSKIQRRVTYNKNSQKIITLNHLSNKIWQHIFKQFKYMENNI